MADQELISCIGEAREIAKELNNLLHDDAFHRLQLYQTYSYDKDANNWTPDLYHRCQLIETLCRRLESPNITSPLVINRETES